jgi:hypothetical protein
MITWVIGNGISHRRWYDIPLHPSIGCNMGIRHFDLDHVVCVDRLAVHEISKLKAKPNTTYWCKESPLETPEGWKKCEAAGIDSGSTALKLAAKLYPNNEIIVIGFDGVLGQSNENAYNYHFRPSNITPERIRKKHRKAVIDLLPDLPPTRFVGIQDDPELEIIRYDKAFEIAIKTSREISKIYN